MARKPRRRSRPAGAEWAAVGVLVVLVAMLWKFLNWGVVGLVVGPAVLWVLASQWSWLHQHRRRLAPVAVGVGVAGFGFGSLAVGSWWSLAVYAAVTFGIGWAIHLEDSHDHRVYFTVCLVAALGWSGALHLLPIATVVDASGAVVVQGRWLDLTASWLVLVVLATAFWWTDRQVAHAVQIEDNIRSWPEIVKGTDLAGTRRTTFKEKPEGGWRMKLTWNPGQKMIDSVTKQARLLESLMDAPRQSVVIEPDGDNPNAVIAECSPTGALGALEWDGQPLVSITEHSLQARFSDGAERREQRWEPNVGGKHKLRAGMTRSGKSVSAKLDACLYGPAEDVVLWLIDRKGGVAFRPLAPMADWFAVDEHESVAMLEAAVRVCDARANYMAEQGWDVWQPSRQHPVVILMIDETARLLGFQAPAAVQGRALAAATAVGQLGAGVGVLVDPCTQFPTLEALGSSQFREQLGITECYRQRSEGTAQHFLPNAPAGVEPAHIRSDRKGEHYVDAEGIFRPQRAQKPNVTPEQVAEVVAEYWDTTPALDDISAAAAGAAYAERDRWDLVDGKPTRRSPGDIPAATSMVEAAAPVAVRVADDGPPIPSWHDLDDEDEPSFRELVAVERSRMSPEERKAAVAEQATLVASLRPADPEQAPALVLELMRRVHPEPVSPRHARDVTGLSESTVHRLLRRWEDEGTVEHVGYGSYRLAAADVPA